MARAVLLVWWVLCAGACALPDEQDEQRWAAVESAILGADEQPSARVKLKTCGEHFQDCHASKLGDIEDDLGYSRCARCLELCDEETGCWPDRTAQGKDCDYTKEKYRRRRNEVRP
jgi:hypothetical protein